MYSEERKGEDLFFDSDSASKGGGVSLKTDGSWGSEGSCHSDLASRVGLGCL